MEPQFAIAGPGWEVSFQRRVGAANRGVLAFVALDSASDRKRVLVPLGAGEALWIAVMAGPAIVVSGHAGADPLRVVKLPAANDGSVLHLLDAVVRSGLSLPLDSEAIARADDPDKIGNDPLTIILKNPIQGTVERIAIIPGTPRIYTALSGLPAPRPSTERDEYGGWLLPQMVARADGNFGIWHHHRRRKPSVNAVNLTRHNFHAEWNYTVSPKALALER